MEGYGSFRYDHEGTPARRAHIIRDGVLEEFLNNRQTAAILGVAPNGSARSTEAHLAPLIRMTNTVFAPGEQDPRDIVSGVDSGYYVVGHRTPSIAESRENFRITAVKVYEIERGRLGRLYRDGGITAGHPQLLPVHRRRGQRPAGKPHTQLRQGPAHAGQAHEQRGPHYAGNCQVDRAGVIAIDYRFRANPSFPRRREPRRLKSRFLLSQE